MSGTAEIYPDAELNPTKEDIAARYGGIKTLIGTARIVDPAGKVGIEIYFGGEDSSRQRLIQLPVTYRENEIDPEGTLTEMEHNILGKRFVTNALHDPVAVTEIIRTIVQGDDGAAHSDGPAPAFRLQGSGDEPETTVEEAQIAEATRQRAVGTVTVNGEVLSYKLRMTNLPHPFRRGETGYSTSRLHLTATPANAGSDTDSDDDALVIAELVLSDGLFN
ncbi:hypothetical protein C3B44_00505 [Corynebacterium yudongzhengii]|uniref:Maltokinase N-terminal cap domain-containing protein n=1 Tax=Corynebacterium yudongzhengii TaxID=2080740 RepID=A0A2U1T5I9_9CORY|nr:hypothetical protein [Corynebacterium yudongzhengii]AWB81014.1 hypothetical protein C3B44_00505 [Corynebacterium yudongzhengii]PWC01259.1 hypothetical protein DF222_08165 [Corynebacterium yudongzhengii]